MDKALGILLIFAGIAGGYAVVSGKLFNATVPPTPPTPGPSGEAATPKPVQVPPSVSGDNKPTTGSGGKSWQSSVMGIPMLLTHTGDIVAARGM